MAETTKPIGAQAVDRALDGLEPLEDPEARLTLSEIAAALAVQHEGQ